MELLKVKVNGQWVEIPAIVGPPGEQGDPGQSGQPGQPGFSPTISVTDITGGHRVTITDAIGDHSFDVMNGSDADAPVQDVQVNGTSILQDGVANVPIASADNFGVVKLGDGLRLSTNGSNVLLLTVANAGDVRNQNNTHAVTGARSGDVAFFGLAAAAGDTTQKSIVGNGVYTEKTKKKISDMLNAPETVSGTTPTITALPGIRYVCGEVSTLTIVLPASGIVDVVFESGSTATVLTVTPPTGVTVKWANGFDPTALDANTTYEINIMDGLGVVGAWT